MPGASYRLSVPSSSGNTLQRYLPDTAAAIIDAPFSPLFIGEYSSTLAERAGILRQSIRFQSPLHRGILFNTRATGRSVPRRSRSFSPLFIGEYSSTTTVTQLVWQCATCCLSVPSSSGNTLQPLFIPCRFNDLQAVFYHIVRNDLICRKTRQVCENTNRMCVRAEH